MAGTWAAIGETPTLYESWRPYARVNVTGALAVRKRRGRLRARLFFHAELSRRKRRKEEKDRRTLKGEGIATFLKRTLSQIPGKVTVVLDGARQHTGRAVTALFRRGGRAQDLKQPGYSPDLNPQEGVWGAEKGEKLVNYAAPDGPTLLHKVRSTLRSLQKDENRLLACLEASSLPWGGLLKRLTER